MSGVNELFQNIRFLKFYGWGTSQKWSGALVELNSFPDNRWAHKVNELRELELAWRVKEGIVGLLVYFTLFSSFYLMLRVRYTNLFYLVGGIF